MLSNATNQPKSTVELGYMLSYTSRYLDDTFTIDNLNLKKKISVIYLVYQVELHLNNAN